MSSPREIPFRLLIFDWDGTVMDSVGAIVACMRATAERMDLPAVSEAAVRRVIGLGLGDTLESLLPETSERERERVVEVYRQLWFSEFRDRPHAYAEARETLAALREEGYLLAVATGKSRAGLERDLEKTGFGEFFCSTRTADEAFPKPHPDMVEGLLEELGCRPAEALVVGDTDHDVEMARNAGVPAVAVEGGAQGREELLRARPEALLSCLGELRSWLKSVGRRGRGTGRRGEDRIESGP